MLRVPKYRASLVDPYREHLRRHLTPPSTPSMPGTPSDTLLTESAFRLDRQNPSTRFIVPAQKALSRSHKIRSHTK